MQVKFKNKLSDYDYLIMFDLASKNTGVCVWDIQNHCPLNTVLIQTDSKHELQTASLYAQINTFFTGLQELTSWDKIIVAKEAMPTQLRGGSSTVQTFLALARSHAILDTYTYLNNIAIYDYIGVYPASTHAYIKKILGLDNKQSVDKNDIKQYVCSTYQIYPNTLDETDAVFLAQTLIDVKWNKDIDEEIRSVKKHKKTLVSTSACAKCDTEISRLEELKL